MSILDPRAWLAAVLALAVAFGMGYFKGDRNGRKASELAHAAAVAAANEDARRLERARQSRADQAAAIAAGRAAGIRAAADRARGELGLLRNELAALHARSQSCPAEAERTAAVGELLRQCAQAHGELAQRADRHVNDLRLLLESWPTDSP